MIIEREGLGKKKESIVKRKETTSGTRLGKKGKERRNNFNLRIWKLHFQSRSSFLDKLKDGLLDFRFFYLCLRAMLNKIRTPGLLSSTEAGAH